MVNFSSQLVFCQEKNRFSSPTLGSPTDWIAEFTYKRQSLGVSPGVTSRKRILNFFIHALGSVRLRTTESSNFTLASLISRNRCRLDDITTPGLRWTVGGKGTLPVRWC